MATVSITEDAVAGQTSEETADGTTLPRVFLVQYEDDNVPSFGKVLAVGILNGIPAVGDVHPYDPLLFVRSKSIAVLTGDNTIFTVTCNYAPTNADERQPDDDAPAQISVGTTTVTQRTDLDRDGNQMILTPADGDGPDDVTDLEPQTFIVDVSKVLGVFRLVRKENEQPGNIAMQYTNKINSAEFLGREAGEVYCDSIQGESSDGGETYTVTYSFTVDPDGWDVRGVYIRDGEPVPDVDEDGEPNDPPEALSWGTEKFFDVFTEIDFNDLNLT